MRLTQVLAFRTTTVPRVLPILKIIRNEHDAHRDVLLQAGLTTRRSEAGIYVHTLSLKELGGAPWKGTHPRGDWLLKLDGGGIRKPSNNSSHEHVEQKR